LTNCRQVLEALSGYLDDELTSEMRNNLEAHLARCRNCHALYDSSRHTLKLVTESGAFELPPGLSERLWEKIRDRGDGNQ